MQTIGNVIANSKEFEDDRGELRNFLNMPDKELVKNWAVSAAKMAAEAEREESGTSPNIGHTGCDHKDNFGRPAGKHLFPLLFYYVLQAVIAMINFRSVRMP